MSTGASTARDEILRRVRDALRDLPPPAPVPAHSAEYLRTDASPRDEILSRFVERVAEYKAKVERVAPAALPAAIAAACARRGVRRLVVPHDIPSEWLPAGIEILRDPGLSNEQLEQSDGVLTACTVGIAQTGTIVLDGGAGQGRRAITLLPDYHLCVIRQEQVVGLVPEAVAQLHEQASRPGHPLTWISGPSATSDIELNRVEGVHGPRTLEVLVVG